MTNLKTLLTLLVLFSLIAVLFVRQAFGREPYQSGRPAPEAAQPRRGAGSESGREKDVRPLEPGRPIKRELAGRQRHTYQIELGADQFLKAIVEQQGIDVVVWLLGPDRKPILEFNPESGSQRQKEVSLVAEAAGRYLLIVDSLQKETFTGSYEIRIEELRAATDTDRALHEARKQYEEALKLQRAGKYDEALQLVERALEIRERLLGGEHPDVATAIDILGGIHSRRGKYAEAEPLYRRALEIREKAWGKDHPDTAQSLSNLADIYARQARYVEAEPLYRRAFEIREKALGKDHRETTQSFNNLTWLYQTLGKYEEAERLLKGALEIHEKAPGRDYQETVIILHSLAGFYYSRGKYEEAEPLFKRILEIHERALGKDHKETASSLSNLALLYEAQGRYEEAETLYRRVLEIREKALGTDHRETARSLSSLAELYLRQERYEEAETLYRRTIDIWEKAPGKDHPETAIILRNLADIHRRQGKYEEVEPLYRRALEIREKALGTDHPDTANSLSDLARLYVWQRRYEEAEPLYRRALEIHEKAWGKDHPSTANSLSNLAGFYYSQRRYEEAEPLFRRALEINEKTLGTEHPNTGAILYSLARLYQAQGRLREAEPLYRRALEINEKTLGTEHPNTAQGLDNLAAIYAAKGDIVQAIGFQSRADAASELILAHNLVIGSERRKLAYLAGLSGQTDRTISLHLRSAPDDPVARNLAAALILQRKGRALDATSQNLNALRSRFNPEDQALLDRLTQTRSQIASLVLDRPKEMAIEQYRKRIKELDDRAERHESDISRRSSEFRAQFLPITLESVRAAIPPDSVLIEFASYRPFNAGAKNGGETYGQAHYVAYVLRREGEIGWRELGEAKAIDAAIAAFREALRDSKRRDVKRLARAVDAKVFRPIRPLLGDLTRLLISPDGPLNLIPFAALVDEKGRYLVERYSISYLTSGRDLLRLQVARESKSGPLVVAAPDFGSRGEIEVAGLRGRKTDASKRELREQVKEESARSAFREFYFRPLPGAAQEGEALHALLPGSTLLTSSQATKAALIQVHSPRLLHIATHGFFLRDQQLTLAGGRDAQSLIDDPERQLQQLDRRGIRLESPLLRSGLALAGANEHKEDDNGILTALEVTGLNLWGTKLVALSACDTGVGEVKNGDGVHGLRRALVLAGAETQVMSLWAVSDRATRELMISYYGRLQQGEGRGEALRQVQLEMLKNMNRRHPCYWASFIQSGEWANLDGRR